MHWQAQIRSANMCVDFECIQHGMAKQYDRSDYAYNFKESQKQKQQKYDAKSFSNSHQQIREHIWMKTVLVACN